MSLHSTSTMDLVFTANQIVQSVRHLKSAKLVLTQVSFPLKSDNVFFAPSQTVKSVVKLIPALNALLTSSFPIIHASFVTSQIATIARQIVSVVHVTKDSS